MQGRQDKMKKLSGNTIVNIIAAVLLLVTLILVEVSFQTAQGWFDTNYNPLLIALAVLGIVLLVLIAGLNITGTGADSKVVSNVKMLASAGACACAGMIFGLTMGAIATEFAYTFFSNFNQGTAKEYFMPTACTEAAIGMVLAVVTVLVAAITNAFNEQRA